MNIKISIPQEDHERFSQSIDRISETISIRRTTARGKDCGRYGDGFMINYSLLIPFDISISKPSDLIMGKIKSQILEYLSGNEKAIAVTNVKGDKILFQSPVNERNKLDLDAIFKNLFPAK